MSLMKLYPVEFSVQKLSLFHQDDQLIPQIFERQKDPLQQISSNLKNYTSHITKMPL